MIPWRRDEPADLGVFRDVDGDGLQEIRALRLLVGGRIDRIVDSGGRVAFDVYRQLIIEVAPHPDGQRVDLRTVGLASVRRPELAMLGVPQALTSEAGAILNHVAGHVANVQPIADGERFATPNSAGALVIRLVRDGLGGVQRVVDGFDPTDGVPWIALSTILLWKAKVADDRGDRAVVGGDPGGLDAGAAGHGAGGYRAARLGASAGSAYVPRYRVMASK